MGDGGVRMARWPGVNGEAGGVAGRGVCEFAVSRYEVSKFTYLATGYQYVPLSVGR